MPRRWATTTPPRKSCSAASPCTRAPARTSKWGDGQRGSLSQGRLRQRRRRGRHHLHAGQPGRIRQWEHRLLDGPKPVTPNGRALWLTLRVTSASSGAVRVKSTALNTSDSLELTFSNNSLTLAAQSTSLAVGGKDSTLLTATYAP